MRSLLRRPRRRTLLVLCTLLLVVGAGGGAWLLLREETVVAEPATQAVSTTTVQETVAASGTIQAARTDELSFEVAGTVTAVLAQEGDRVRTGQRLATVDPASLTAARTAARSSYEAALAQLDEDLDADASELQVAADRANVLSARDALAEAREAVEDATLRATGPGTVVAVALAVGDDAGGSSGSGSSSGGSTSGAATTAASADTASTSAQVTVVSTGRFEIAATVSAADVERLEEGLQAEITPSGVTETVYGTVSSVGLVAETDSSGAAVFPVTIEVTGRRTDLYAGTSADVSIIVEQRAGVLTVPSRALESEDGATYVTRVVDGESVRTEVEVGTTYGASTEVTSGLAEGDTIEIATAVTQRGGTGTGEQQLPEGFPADGQMPEGFPGGAQ